MIRLNDEQRRLTADNIALVPVAIQKYGRMGLEYDDAFQIGAMGLMRAAAHYDESRGVKFSTYAMRCIKTALGTDLRKRMAVRRGGGVTPLSLDAPCARRNGLTLGDMLRAKDDVERQQLEGEMHRAFEQMLALQPERFAKIARMFWIDGLTQREISAAMGLAPQTIHRIVWGRDAQIPQAMAGGRGHGMSGIHPASLPESATSDPAEVQRFVESQKTVWTACPIHPIPIKPEYHLYTHQVRAYNIALALMGYDPEGGTDDDTA